MRSGAAIRAISPIRTAICGRWPGIRTGRSPRTAAPGSATDRLLVHALDQDLGRSCDQADLLTGVEALAFLLGVLARGIDQRRPISPLLSGRQLLANVLTGSV